MYTRTAHSSIYTSHILYAQTYHAYTHGSLHTHHILHTHTSTIYCTHTPMEFVPVFTKGNFPILGCMWHRLPCDLFSQIPCFLKYCHPKSTHGAGLPPPQPAPFLACLGFYSSSPVSSLLLPALANLELLEMPVAQVQHCLWCILRWSLPSWWFSMSSLSRDLLNPLGSIFCVFANSAIFVILYSKLLFELQLLLRTESVDINQI